MKNNYNAMYKSSIKDEDETPVIEETAPVEEPAVVAEEVLEDVKIEEPKVEEEKIEETPVKVESSEKNGIVTGSLSLNVRKEPNGDIIKTIAPNEKVIIKDEDGDWFKISSPVEGFVMKKFINVI